jgi:hypothetical protein
VEGFPAQAVLDQKVTVERSGWVKASCHGSGHTAVTSPIYVQVRDHPAPGPSEEDLSNLHEELDKNLHWVQTQARCETEKLRERLISIYVAAKEELERRSALIGS